VAEPPDSDDEGAEDTEIAAPSGMSDVRFTVAMPKPVESTGGSPRAGPVPVPSKRRPVAERRQRLCVLALAVAFAGCGESRAYQAKFTPPTAMKQVDDTAPFLKCHMRDGRVFVLEAWHIDEEADEVRGTARFATRPRRPSAIALAASCRLRRGLPPPRSTRQRSRLVTHLLAKSAKNRLKSTNSEFVDQLRGADQGRTLYIGRSY
jgi:hypothetical protein